MPEETIDAITKGQGIGLNLGNDRYVPAANIHQRAAVHK